MSTQGSHWGMVLPLFQSAPLTEARGDSVQGFNPLRGINHRDGFQSAPLTEARGDSGPASAVCARRVSIRSPHRSKGRPAQGQAHLDLALFQSAPLTEARGDAGRPHRAGHATVCVFQSAPLTEARGDLQARTSAVTGNHGLFQSAPLTEARGDRVGARTAAGQKGFNPLPSPKQGETSPGRPARSYP